MKIDYLANHTHLIPTVATWYLEAWGKYSESFSIESAKTRILGRLNIDKLDVCFLCFHDDEIIGTMSLAHKDIPNNENFTPCLSNLFVLEKHRHQKIGEQLIEYAKQKAKDLKFEKMYLYTTNKTIHFWYEKLGWKIIKEDNVKNLDIKIMEIDL